MRIHIGSDHGGVELREQLKERLAAATHEIVSLGGPATASESCDYPDVAHEICQRLKADPESVGILVCGTGQGMAMAANHHPGIRAAVVSDAFSTRMAREHNDANVLCLGARVLGSELAWLLVEEFLATPFGGGRHARRVGKIEVSAD